MLIGGSGDDSIYAYGGDDVLIGGSGVDDLFGGAGSDTFVLSSGYGFDVIRDFEDGVDRIELNFGFSDLRLDAYSNGDVLVSDGRDVLALVKNAAGLLQETAPGVLA